MRRIEYLCVLGTCLAILGPSPSSSTSPLIPHPTVYTNLFEDTEIFCSVTPTNLDKRKSENDQPYCRFSRSPLEDDSKGKKTITVHITDGKVNTTGPGSFSYFGNGVTKGECGLKIHNVTSEQIGKWGCDIFSDGHLWSGNVDVIKYESPSQPILVINGNSSEISVTDFQSKTLPPASTLITCCSVGGKPLEETKLSLHLDEKEIPNIVLKRGSGIHPTTCISWAGNFTKEDNDQILSCHLSHPANMDNENNNLTRVNTTVHVKYGPEIMGKNDTFITERRYNKEKTEVDLHFLIRGNPEPEVKITKPDTKDATLETVTPINTNVIKKKNSFEIILTLKAPGKKEENEEYQITVTNEFGVKTSEFVVTPASDDEKSNFWTKVIVGSIMAFLFIGIIIFVLNYNARKRGWFCYKTRTAIYPVKKRGERNATVTTDAAKNDNNDDFGYSAVAMKDQNEF